MTYKITVKAEAYATEAGAIVKKSMINLTECTIDQTEPATRVEFMVALLPSGDDPVWCLFYNRGGDWNVFGDGAEHEAEQLEGWMPAGVRECVDAVIARIGENAADDMEWFADWADAAEKTLSNSKITKLQAAIDEFSDESGPVKFTAQDNGDTLTLVATYSLKDSPDDKPFNDEPWTQFGGHKIIDRFGGSTGNAGMDRYTDKYGDEMLTQWVCFAK